MGENVRPEGYHNTHKNVVPGRFEIEQVKEKVLHESDVVGVSCTEHKHPSSVLHRVQLVVEHPVSPKQVMPEQCQHSVHYILISWHLCQSCEKNEQSLLFPCDGRLIVILL